MLFIKEANWIEIARVQKMHIRSKRRRTPAQTTILTLYSNVYILNALMLSWMHQKCTNHFLPKQKRSFGVVWRTMRTWEDYKKEAKEVSNLAKQDIEEMEVLAAIVTEIINKRNELGYTQRELAVICGLPQSSVARIEACVVKPNVETLIKIMKPLGLTLSVVNV